MQSLFVQCSSFYYTLARMKYFRKLITYRKLAVFLAVGMLLRSTIAVGYMLDTNPADGSFLSVIICEGPAGINAISGLEDHSQHHENHHDHVQHDSHEHASQDHPTTSCSFWSSSSLSLLADLPLLDETTFLLSDETVAYHFQNLSRLSENSRFARAPPTLI